MFRQAVIRPALSGAARAWPLSRTCGPLVRGLKFMSQDYPPSPGFNVYSEQLEKAIASAIQSAPAPNKAFQRPDGTPRAPTDAELQAAASLAALAQVDRLSFVDSFKLSRSQARLMNANTSVMEDYFLNGRRILDKIPVEDPATGEVTWTIIREGQKEGWENLMYWFYVPCLFGALVLYLFLDTSGMREWAREELVLRAQERHGFVDDSAPAKQRDELIVERILAGDYDRLAGLRTVPAEMPSSLL